MPAFDEPVVALLDQLRGLPRDEIATIGRILSDPARPHGRIVASDVPLADYERQYGFGGYEYVDGYVIDVTGAEIIHQKLIYFLHTLIDGYFELRPIGQIIGQPFTIKLPAFPRRRREPDLLVVLDIHDDRITDTFIDGPPDICIEVISEESIERDNHEKFAEYAAGGVTEYWIFDPLHSEVRFYRLGSDGSYTAPPLDGEIYRTPALPGLALRTDIFWQQRFPGPHATAELVRAMMED